MVLEDNVAIRARRKKVWDFLTNSNQIGQCVPGVEKIESGEPNKKYRGIDSVEVGCIKARFNGDLDGLKMVEPNPARFNAHGTAIDITDLLIEAFS